MRKVLTAQNDITAASTPNNIKAAISFVITTENNVTKVSKYDVKQLIMLLLK